MVADRTYMPDLRSDLCATAFLFECRAGKGRLVGSFADSSASANAYRGELLGLMAAHLVLWGLEDVFPTLTGKITMYSDCEGALDMVSNLPEKRLSARCKHSDVLKNILLHRAELPFTIEMIHVEAHQDDKMDFHLLS
jgi:hypothetical protein